MSERRTAKSSIEDPRRGRTDWKRLRTMTDEEVEAGALDDPHNPPWTEDELANADLVYPTGERKVPVSIRLDREVIDFFKEDGPGYQSRISAVLLAYVRSRRSRG